MIISKFLMALQLTDAFAQADAASAAAQPQPGFLGMVLPFALMFAVMYFLLIRPQQKKMKEHQETLGKIQHGDEIVTTGGLLGKVTGVTDKVLTLEVADGVKVKVLKNQVAGVNPNLTTAAK